MWGTGRLGMTTKKKLTTKTTRDFACTLTELEKLEYGKKLADLGYSKEQIEADKKAATEGFKQQLAAVESGSKRLISAIRDGMERREVDCEWIYRWESLTKELVRCDTGEIVEREVIGVDERQIGLDGIDAN